MDPQNTLVVNVQVKNLFYGSVESDDMPLYDKTPEFNAEVHPDDCVDVNL